MQISIVGLGRMGMNMARRLLAGKHEVLVYNRTQEKVRDMQKEGAIGSVSLEDMVKKIRSPRVIWIMLPAGEVVDQHIAVLSGLLSPGDIIVDGGNSYYKDDIIRAAKLKPRGIHYMDAGVSGGIWGLELGYCTMVGGDKQDFEYIEPILQTLAPENGYLYCGPSGAGHFIKMVHNGIEYGMMEAYGEGFEIIRSSPYGDIALNKIAHLWNQGSVVRSWLLELLESALVKDPHLATVEGYVEDSGEGRWTVMEAVESGVPADAIAHSLFKRFRSKQLENFSDKIIAALRREFGGHSVKRPKSENRWPKT